MDLDFTNKGKAKVSMIKYPERLIYSFPNSIAGHSDSPTAAHLFNVHE